MPDALVRGLRHSLPPELSLLLEDSIQALEHGQYHQILGSHTCRLILGFEDNTETSGILLTEEHTWQDWIFRRVGSLLAKRQHAEPTDTPSSLHIQYQLFVIALAALQTFLQSNVTGPPLDFESAQVVLPEKVLSSAGSVRRFRGSLIDELSSDGEAVYKLTPNVELFSLAATILTASSLKKDIAVFDWARFRVDFIHQRLLSERSSSLQKAIYKSLDEAEKRLQDFFQNQPESWAEFLLERASINLHHGYDQKTRADVDLVSGKLGFEFALTGLLGKRTKYQERDVSQLVVLAQSKEANTVAEGNAAPKAASKTASKPDSLDLNDDTLLESISFSHSPASRNKTSADFQDSDSLPASLSSLDPASQPLLAPLDSIVLLTLASSITNTSPADGLTREETLPYAVRVLDGGSSNWQIYTQALLVRSRIEGYKSRTLERGLLQLQALVDQVIAETTTHTGSSSDTGPSSTFLPRAKDDESAPAQDRLRYIYQLCSPARWELEAELAARWVSVGGLRSALDIYERLEMWAEAALCWAATEREDKARKVIRRQLFHSSAGAESDDKIDPDEDEWNGPAREPTPTEAPRLYCILGDLNKDPAFYEKAWDISKQRYARAQRSLGRFYYAQKDFAKASSAYAKSLSVNKLNHQSWFALGCALLEMAQFEKAAGAFSRCISLDDTDAEAYSNLAAALLRRGPVPEVKEEDDSKLDQQQHIRDALTALKRAASIKFDDYRIWDNLLTVSASLSPPAYSEVISAQMRIIDMRGPTDGEKCIDASILELLVQDLLLSSEYEQDSSSISGSKRLLLELLDKKVVPLITGSARLWMLIAKVNLWRNRPSRSLEAYEKAWRTTTAQVGWDGGDEAKWKAVVTSTSALIDAYRLIGPMEKTEGLAAGSGELVAKDWKFKSRSALRSVMGRAKSMWEGNEGWHQLESSLQGLREGQ